MPPTPYKKAKSGWPSAWLTWILTPEERECLHLKGCRLRNAYKHKQERGVLTIAAQSLVSLSAEKTETPAGSRPSKRPKNAAKPQEQKRPKRCLRNPLKTKGRSRRTKSLPQPSRDTDKNKARRQWMRNSQTPPKSEPKTAQNATKPQA